MALSDQDRAARHRQRMRAAGLRPLQMWVPDTGQRDFPARLRRQVERLRGQPEEQGALDFIEAVQSEDELH